MEEGIQICKECVKDIRLKYLIKKNNISGNCSGCGNKALIIDADSNEFGQMIKALIRYHYSEWEYNTHWGGDGYGALIHKDDNIFFNKPNFNDKDMYDELVNRIENIKVYEDYEKGVSIFAGYDENGQQNMLLQSIKTDIDSTIIEIEDRLKIENYFDFEKQIIKMLSEYKTSCQLKMKKEEAFYRARIGVVDKKRSLFGGGFEGEVIYVPFSNSQIGAPPPYLAGHGRINRSGVSFLYCATEKDTAVAEVRPHPGDMVSIGKFIINKELSLFDLTEMQFLNYFDSDKKLDSFKTLNTFTELMQKVIPPSERYAYNITQLIADCIRQLGFNGVLFPSSVGTGHNVVVFDPKVMDYTYDEAEVIEVKEVNYKYESRKWKKDIKEIE